MGGHAQWHPGPAPGILLAEIVARGVAGPRYLEFPDRSDGEDEPEPTLHYDTQASAGSDRQRRRRWDTCPHTGRVLRRSRSRSPVAPSPELPSTA
eukprot:15435915-Alexandrium_andersonii.AAC.1